jgi:Transposase DDE domain
MTTITELHENVQELLTSVANVVARTSGFIKRQRQLTGAGFAQALILGGLLEPKATRRQQHQHAVLAGEQMSLQGFEQRVEQAESVAFMEGLLKQTLTRVVTSGQRRVVFPAFNGVYLTDCTRLVWPGLGKKAGVRLNIQDGQLEVALMGLKDNDQKTEVVERELPKGALHVADLGFFKLERFKRWSAQGIYWLTRYKIGTLLFHQDGTPIDLATWLQQATAPLNLPVLVGAPRLPATLLAAPLTDEALAKRTARLKEQARLDQKPLPARQLALSCWTIYLTNVPTLTFDHAFILARARWQIELLFKLWKSHALLLTSRSTNPIRQQVEGLAKFIGVIVSHWCLLLTGWHQDALSPLDALRLLRLYVPALWRALHDPLEWQRLFDALCDDLSNYAPLSKRRRNPLAFQLWAEFDFAFP